MPRRDLDTIVDRFNTAEDILQPRFEDWHDYYKLYRSVSEADDDSAFSNLFIPHVFTNIEQIVPRLVSEIVRAEPMVSVQPNSADDVLSSQVIESLINWQLKRQQFTKKLVRIIKDALIYGTCFAKSQWTIETAMVGTQDVVKYRGPTFEYASPFRIFPDPHATSMDDCLYIIDHYYVDRETLEDWQEQDKVGPTAGGESLDNLRPVFNRDDDEERFKKLRNIGKLTTNMSISDDTREWHEIYEYWEEDRVQMVANEKVLIRDEPNPFVNQRIPFFVFRDYPIGDEFYGLGEVENIQDIQHEINTQRNQRIDARSLSINPIIQAAPGALISNDELVFEPGRIWRVNPGQVRPFALPDTGTPSVQEEQIAAQNIKETTSVTDIVRGQTAQNFPRSATGVSTLDVNAQTRFEMKVRNFESPIQKMVEHMVQMDQQFLNEEQTIRITGEVPNILQNNVREEGPFRFLEFGPTQIAGFFDYEVKGAKSVTLLQRQQKFLQLLQIGPQFSSEFNIKEVLRRLFESMEVKDIDRILNVPDEQIDRLQQVPAQGSNPSVQQQNENPNAGNQPRGPGASPQLSDQEQLSQLLGASTGGPAGQ